MPIERVTTVPGAPPATFLDGDGEFAETFPLLWEYVFRQRWDDGAARETSTLMIFARDGGWTACLNDRQHKRGLWVSAPTYLGICTALEEALAGPGGGWRPYRDAPRKR